MLKYIKLIVVLFTLCSLTSCFEIIEGIKVNENGSGHYALTLNLSQSKSKLSSIMLLDSVRGYSIPSEKEIEGFLKTKTALIDQVEGISNVQHQLNLTDFIVEVEFDFEKVDQLNKVLSKLHRKEDIEFNHYGLQNNNVFYRTYQYDLKKLFGKIDTNDKKIFEGSSVTTIYRFDKPVESIENKQAKLSPNKKAVMLKVNSIDLFSQKSSLKNTISLK